MANMDELINTLGLGNERATSLYKELEGFQLPDGTLKPPSEFGSNFIFTFKKTIDDSFDAVSISVLSGGANIETSLLAEGEYIKNVSLGYEPGKEFININELIDELYRLDGTNNDEKEILNPEEDNTPLEEDNTPPEEDNTSMQVSHLRTKQLERILADEYCEKSNAVLAIDLENKNMKMLVTGKNIVCRGLNHNSIFKEVTEHIFSGEEIFSDIYHRRDSILMTSELNNFFLKNCKDPELLSGWREFTEALGGRRQQDILKKKYTPRDLIGIVSMRLTKLVNNFEQSDKIRLYYQIGGYGQVENDQQQFCCLEKDEDGKIYHVTFEESTYEILKEIYDYYQYFFLNEELDAIMKVYGDESLVSKWNSLKLNFV
jgi:hypothetical protein